MVTSGLKLNLGCNQFKIPGWVDVDIVPDFKPDFLEDCITLPSFSDNTVSEIYAGHLLEHVDNTVLALKRWLSILEPGGRLTVTVPNMEVAHQLWRERKDFPVLGVGPLSGLLAVCTGFYGLLDYTTQEKDNPARAKAQIHKRVFDKSLLLSLFELIGFEEVEETDEYHCEPAPKFQEPVIWQVMVTGVKPKD